MNLFAAYIRWRHSRGFGVHSPFAYHIVCSAISPGRAYGFYGYQAIDAEMTPGLPPAVRRDARLLLRLAYALDIEEILLPEDTPGPLKTAARAAGAAIKPLIHCSANGVRSLALLLHEEDPAPFLADGSAVLVIAPKKTDLSYALPPDSFRGLILLAPRKALIIPRPEMARTLYTMKF